MALPDPAITVVLDHEGEGYVKTEIEESKWGLTKRAHPDLDIKSLTREQAREVYRARWWEGRGYDTITDQAVANKVFDMTVNLGAYGATRLVQRAINYLRPEGREVCVDGVFGPQTLEALNHEPAWRLLSALRAYHAHHYVTCMESEKEKFYKASADGWLARALT